MASSLSSAGAASSRLPRAAVARAPWLALASTALIAGTGFAGGGYFPSSWGWPTLAAAWAAVLALLVGERAALGRAGAAAAALLAALAGWTALSAIWSTDLAQSLLEAQRTAVYVAAVLAALLWARLRPERLLHGVWAASVLVCGWGLVTRIVPDRFGVVDPISGFRLSEPVGYWNALGLLAAIGILLGLGLTARAPSRFGRAIAAASLPVLALTLYFTFSRGAWIALAAGFLASLALSRRRLQLLAALAATAPWTAFAVWRAAVSHSLTTAGSALPEMTGQGHRLALVALATAGGSALTTIAVAALEPRMRLGTRSRVTIGATIAAAALAGVALAFVHFGSPTALTARAWHNFSHGDLPASSNQNARLFHLSGEGRTTQWSVAWSDAKGHPVLGSGAGSFERVWFRNRPIASKVRDAHNLYVETLAELGPLGLALLAAVLTLPLAAAFRRRDRHLAFAAAGAYSAFVLHAAVDWDWEITSVTLAALLCGAALLAAPGRPLTHSARRVALGGALLLAVTGVYTIASQLPLTKIGSAAARGDWRGASRHAKRASELAPWSAQPWLLLGEADLNAGRVTQAREPLRKAIAKDSSDWVAWLDLARATTGHTRAHALARATELNPLGPAK